jgi:hypothetical protein
MRNVDKLIPPNEDTLYRIISSQFPPISVFEDVTSPADLEIAFHIESMTNDHIQNEVGNLSLVARDDMVLGPGSTPLMAAFTHIGKASRFTTGMDYGVYYAGDSLQTAMSETTYHQEHFLRATNEPDTTLTMRCYTNHRLVEMLDITGDSYAHLHLNDYSDSQIFGRQQRSAGYYGIYYHSVRHKGGFCVAAFMPKALSIPKQSGHYQYQYKQAQKKITHIFRLEDVSF